MKQVLSFLKDFRPVNGHDGAINNLEFDDLTDLPTQEGVYIITSDTTKFTYPKGMSKVIYIGKASSIRRRLKEHQSNLRIVKADTTNKYWDLNRYNYMKYHGAQVLYYLCLGNQDSKDLESDILFKFYDKYGAMPVGNGARSFHKELK